MNRTATNPLCRTTQRGFFRAKNSSDNIKFIRLDKTSVNQNSVLRSQYRSLEKITENMTVRPNRVVNAENSLLQIKSQLSGFQGGTKRIFEDIDFMKKKINSQLSTIGLGEHQYQYLDQLRINLKKKLQSQLQLNQFIDCQRKTLQFMLKRATKQELTLRFQERFTKEKVSNLSMHLTSFKKDNARHNKQSLILYKRVQQQQQLRKQFQQSAKFEQSKLESFFKKQNFNEEVKCRNEARRQQLYQYQQSHMSQIKAAKIKKYIFANFLLKQILNKKSIKLIQSNKLQENCFRKLKYELRLEEPADMVPRYHLQSQIYRQYTKKISSLQVKLQKVKQMNIQLKQDLNKLQNRKLDVVETNNSRKSIFEELQGKLERMGVAEVLLNKMHRYVQKLGEQLKTKVSQNLSQSIKAILQQCQSLLDNPQ